ncbi:hypothetical protein ACP70R_017178 [Stipagrostis hirtigluma subsp. patula]
MASSLPAPADPSMETVAPRAAVTRERRLNTDLQEEVPKPYLARALEAVDPNHPQGTKGRDPRGMSVLQQHAAFFDRNGDGVICPSETFQGLRAIGCGFLVSFTGAILINLVLSYPTQPGWLPSPLLSIHIKNIHKGKHGSDSETYDTEGRFDPSKFDAIFSKYGRTHPNALTIEELLTMLKGNRNMYDFIGWEEELECIYVLFELKRFLWNKMLMPDCGCQNDRNNIGILERKRLPSSQLQGPPAADNEFLLAFTDVSVPVMPKAMSLSNMFGDALYGEYGIPDSGYCDQRLSSLPIHPLARPVPCWSCMTMNMGILDDSGAHLLR